jgi:hypothetical protein
VLGRTSIRANTLGAVNVPDGTSGKKRTSRQRPAPFSAGSRPTLGNDLKSKIQVSVNVRGSKKTKRFFWVTTGSRPTLGNDLKSKIQVSVNVRGSKKTKRFFWVTRMRAAIAALNYELPRLQVTAQISESDFAAVLYQDSLCATHLAA